MIMARKAQVDENGLVVNVIEIDASFTEWDGYKLIDAPKEGAIGGAWDGKKFLAPPASEAN